MATEWSRRDTAGDDATPAAPVPAARTSAARTPAGSASDSASGPIEPGPRTVVYVEHGTRRVFASALAWPGWCRSARTVDLALEALAEYAGRYAEVAGQAGIVFQPGTVAIDRGARASGPLDLGGRARGHLFEVVESLPGTSSTDFGTPGEIPAADTEPVDAETAARQAALVAAAWVVFDRIVAAVPAQLRKGPRGGGRDRDKMFEHVVGAETAYARRLGVKHRPPAIDDRAAIAALRADIRAVLGAPSDGTPVVPTGWPTRYAARRIAWHVLDHAWEMQDRA